MSRSLLEVLRDVTLDPGEQAAFSADPAGYLAQQGYEDVPADDLAEAFSLVADTLPADVAQAVSPSSLAADPLGSSYSGFGDDSGQTLSESPAGPVLDADPDETSFGAVNNDFDDDAASGVTDRFDAPVHDEGDQDGPDGEAGQPGEDGAGFGFGEGSALEPAGGGVGDLAAVTGSAGEPGAPGDPGAGGDLGERPDDAFASDLDDGFGPPGIEVEQETADFGTGGDGDDYDGGDSPDDGLDFTDPAGDIDDIGAF